MVSWDSSRGTAAFKIYLFFVLAPLLILFQSCSHPDEVEEAPGADSGNNSLSGIIDAAKSTFLKFHEQSEKMYDGTGHWGQAAFNYRMMLRDSYWRADVYLSMAKLGDANSSVYLLRASDAIAYLLRAQTEGGTGVFGIPADVNNPEFGTDIQTIIQSCPSCVSNGWVISMPSSVSPESLYYDHGYALHSVSRAYLFLNDPQLLPAIRKGADWALAQPASNNINYLSALAKGLATSFLATGDSRYLDKAISLHNDHIFPHQMADGQWDDAHNRQLEYHGFIVSGLIALTKVLPEDSIHKATLDSSLSRATAIMATRNLSEDGNYEMTWIGTNVLAWMELSGVRSLNPTEKQALARCLRLLSDNSTKVLQQSGFRLQKGLYANFFIGRFVATPLH